MNLNSCLLSVLLSCSPGTVSEDTQAPIDTDTDTADPDETAEPDGDGDGDGYTKEDGDCDDGDATVHPGAEEVYYDGVDQDCDGESDYDADGDGEDAEAHGGADCDDTDSAVITDCDAPDSPLDHYVESGVVGEIDEISSNLSGVTWNPATGTYMGILDSNRRLHELAADFTHLREIALTSVEHSDLEDIAYLGSDGSDHEFAFVAESGVVYVGVVPEGAETIDLSNFQLIAFAEEPSSFNRGGEGVAYDPASETFWVCSEKSPMTIYTFSRPEGSEDASHEDTLVVTEPFDAEVALGGRISDISSCRYDARTGRLMVLSHEAAVVLDVDADGEIIAELAVTMSKPEGITVTDSQDMTIVGEPNDYRVYTYTGPK